MTAVDPSFPRYLIPQTTIDGPRKTDGEIVFELHFRAVVVPDDERLAAGEPTQLQVFDFAGPKAEPRPEPIDAPPSLMVLFCSVCGETCGVRDHFRIQHEHFDLNKRCKGGMWRVVEYTPSGVAGSYSEVLRAIDARKP